MGRREPGPHTREAAQDRRYVRRLRGLQGLGLAMLTPGDGSFTQASMARVA